MSNRKRKKLENLTEIIPESDIYDTWAPYLSQLNAVSLDSPKEGGSLFDIFESPSSENFQETTTPQSEVSTPTTPLNLISNDDLNLADKVQLAADRKYQKKKLRQTCKKSCSDKKCEKGQYFENEKDAPLKIRVRKGQTTVCECGEPIRYFYNGERVPNSGLPSPSKVTGKENESPF
eukprot:gene10543-3062_t